MAFGDGGGGGGTGAQKPNVILHSTYEVRPSIAHVKLFSNGWPVEGGTRVGLTKQGAEFHSSQREPE